MKNLTALFLCFVFLGSDPAWAASKIFGYAGFYKGTNVTTPVSQFKASKTKEQGGISVKVDRVRRKWSFRDSDFFYKEDHIMYFDEFTGTATIRRGTIRFQANLDLGRTLRGMIRRTPSGIVISQTKYNSDASVFEKTVIRMKRN